MNINELYGKFMTFEMTRCYSKSAHSEFFQEEKDFLNSIANELIENGINVRTDWYEN